MEHLNPDMIYEIAKNLPYWELIKLPTLNRAYASIAREERYRDLVRKRYNEFLDNVHNDISDEVLSNLRQTGYFDCDMLGYSIHIEYQMSGLYTFKRSDQINSDFAETYEMIEQRIRDIVNDHATIHFYTFDDGDYWLNLPGVEMVDIGYQHNFTVQLEILIPYLIRKQNQG